MKNKKILLLLILATAGITACKRDNAVTSPVKLDASKIADIKKGEPVVFTVNKTPGSTATWRVTPGDNVSVQISPSCDTATILFGVAGKFTVQATSASGSATQTVTVKDSIYCGGGGITYTTVPLTGDQIQLAPSRIDSGNFSGISIIASTTKSYDCLNHYLVTQLSGSGSDYNINFPGVNVPDGSNCMSGQAKASGYIFLYPISDGSHAITVVMNGTTYSGSIAKNGSGYTITWPYTSGVTFTKLVL
jgi:hypothetical protein